MRSKYFLKFGLLAIGAAAIGLNAVACGSDPPKGTGGDGGDGGTATTSSSSSSSSSSTSTSSSSSSGNPGCPGNPDDKDGNCDFDTALDLDAAGNVDIFEDPEFDVDFFKFDGEAGAMFLINAGSDPTNPGSDPGYIDTFIELYDEGKNLLATNDDRYPRRNTDSEIITLLPKTGTYYVKIQEWCISPTADPMFCNDAYFNALDTTDYSIFGAQIMPGPGAAVEKEPNETSAAASPITYAPVQGMAGSYYLTTVHGTMPAASDVDVFSFTVPADLAAPPAGSRSKTNILIPWGATTGNGSNLKTGKIDVIEEASMNVVASIDMKAEPSNTFDRADIFMPVTKGGKYFLQVNHGGAEKDGQGDFYFALQTLTSGNPVEKSEATNNMAATPEQLTLAMGTVGSYFVEGDLATGDVDHFTIGTKAQATISIACSAQRGGSGVRGFQASIFRKDGITSVAMGSMKETPTTDVFIDHIAIPAGETDLVIKLEPTMPQDPNVTGTYYICGFHAGPAVP